MTAKDWHKSQFGPEAEHPARSFDRQLLAEIADTSRAPLDFALLRKCFPEVSPDALERALDRLASARRIFCDSLGFWKPTKGH